MVSYLDKGVVESLYKNNNKDKNIRHSLDDCFEYFLLAPPLGYLLEVTLGLQCSVHHGYMNNSGWYETYVYLYHDHEHKNPTIYQDHLDFWRYRGWSETYIHFSHNYQQLLRDY